MGYSLREDFPQPAVLNPILHQPFTREEWDQSALASEAEVQWFRDARYGMFIHFGLSTYNNADLSWGVCQTRKAPDVGQGPVPDAEWMRWPEEFRLEKFDAAEWVRIAQDAGCRYLVLITKHHDGFHMWDTDESEFKITNTPFGRDLTREVADACHAAGMPLGFYYSQRDWVHPDYMPVDPQKVLQDGIHWTLKPGFDSPLGACHQKYIDYQEKVVRELCTRYGKVDIFWWDAIWFGNMFTAEMWDSERINRMIRELQPGILINNRSSIPGDFDTPEGRLGTFQNWRPWESCICLTNTWSYSATPPKEMKQLVKMITNNACGDGNLLLSWGPHWDGEFDAVEKDRLLEFGAWMKANEQTLFGTRGGPWKCNVWGGSVHRDDTIYLHITGLPGGVLDLPALPGVTLQHATRLDGGEVQMQTTAEGIRLTMDPETMDELDTIVEIKADRPLAAVEAQETGRQTLFIDSTTYGAPIVSGITVSASAVIFGEGELEKLVQPDLDFRFSTGTGEHPWVQLDLGGEKTVTGIRVECYANRQRRMTVHAFTSVDGTEWVDHGEVDQPYGEVAVNGYQAGASIPGLPARHVRLAVVSDQDAVLELKHIAVFARQA